MGLLGPSIAGAQQNLFNVPSAEITPKGGLFFQQQFNVNKYIQSSTTIDYGLGRGYEVGLNVIGLPLYDPTLGPNPSTVGRQQPDILVNGLKVFTISERARVGVGTQLGETAPLFTSSVQLANFTYGVGAFDLPHERGTLYGGAFYANSAYRGGGHPFGVLIGCDIPLIENKVHFMADYISGVTDLSVAVVGFRILSNPKLAIFGRCTTGIAGKSESVWCGVRDHLCAGQRVIVTHAACGNQTVGQ